MSIFGCNRVLGSECKLFCIPLDYIVNYSKLDVGKYSRTSINIVFVCLELSFHILALLGTTHIQRFRTTSGIRAPAFDLGGVLAYNESYNYVSKI